MSRDLFARAHRKNINKRRRLLAQQLEQRILLAADDWGPESILNTPVGGNQQTSPQQQSATLFDDGTGLVAYSGNGNGDNKGVYMRSVDSAGVPVGDAIRVNPQRAGRQTLAAIATMEDGSAIVAWNGKGDGDSFGIFARRVAADGSFLSDEFRINETTRGAQRHPVIAPLSDGFAIAWSGYGSGDQEGVFVRRYDAHNRPVSSETRVHPSSFGFQASPQIVALPDGGYAVAWSGFGSDDWLGVYVRRFGADGSATSDVTRVNPDASGYQGSPDLAVLPDGQLLVTWTGKGDGDWWGVYARQFAIDNQGASDAVLVNQNSAGLQVAPTVATSDDGSFLVLWQELGTSGYDTIVKGRHFQSLNSPAADEFELPVTTSGTQSAASLAGDGRGGYLATWTRRKNGKGDVYVRRLPPTATDDTDPPNVVLHLANDTGAPGTDGITADLSLSATITDASAIESVALSISSNSDPPTAVDVTTFYNTGLLNLSDTVLRGLLSEPIIDGEITLQTTATDSAGNVGSSDPLVITLDTLSPGAPVINSIQDSAGNEVADGATNDETLTLRGTAEPGSQLRLLESASGYAQAVTTDGTGQWELTLSLVTFSGETFSFAAQATDAAGNTGPLSQPVSVSRGDVDPPVVAVQLTNDTGPSGNDAITSDLSITGQVTDETDVATLTLSIPEIAFGPADLTSFIAVDGSFDISSLDLNSLMGAPLADGGYTLQVAASDSLGNSAVPTELFVVLDTTAVAPQLRLSQGSDTGIVGDNTTYLQQVDIEGITEPFAGMALAPVGLSATAAVDGVFSFANVPLGTAANQFVATVTDVAGNTTSESIVIQRQELAGAIVLSESPDSLLVEATRLIDVGQASGSRTLRMRIDATFDRTAAGTLEDSLLISLVDPDSPAETLLDRDEAGTTLFMLSGAEANFPAGRVQFDGQYLEMDLTSLTDVGQGLLVFQLVNNDSDSESEVAISEISNVVDPAGRGRLSANFDRPLRPVGGPIDLSNLTVNEDVRVSIQNIHLDTVGERYSADLRVQNSGQLVGSDAVVVIKDLPAGVNVTSASGIDASANPYLSFAELIDPIGLDAGVVTDRIRLEISNPGMQPFELNAEVLTRTLSSDPIAFDSVDDLTVAAGEVARVSLSATDPDGRRVLYSLVSDGPTPTLSFDSSGELVVRPAPEQAGTYNIGLVASVGSKRTRQNITLTVTADVAAVTSVAGSVLDVDGTPLAGVPVVLGRISATTDSQGRFTIELPSSLLPTEEFDIAVPAGDVFFDPFDTGNETIDFRRARYDTSTGTDASNPRRHPNLVSSFLDASAVYGSDDARALALRTLNGGRLKTQTGPGGELLPFNSTDFFPSGPLENDSAGPVDPASLFAAGDVRSSENPMLASLHTILVREHNRLAAEIATADPSLDDEAIFQRARKMVGAILQHITYYEYLPLLLGENSVAPYSGYDASADPSVGAFFTTVAFRIGHSQTPDQFDILDSDGAQILGAPLSSQHASFNTGPIVQHGVDPVLRGMLGQPIESVDLRVGDALRNMLFGPPGSGGLDLPSLSIQRARDLGLPSYNQARIDFGFAPIATFAEISSDPETVSRLALAYDSVDKIDAFVGGIAEDHVAGAMVGPLFHAVIKAQFENARASDRFWYENGQFSAGDLAAIRSTTIAGLLERNSGLSGLTGNQFSTTANPVGSSAGGASTTDSAAEFRSIDGAGNNIADPLAGATGSWLRGDTGQYYLDGVSQPNGSDRPSPRAISNAALDQGESLLVTNGANTLAIFWSQLIAHEFSLTPTGTSDTLRFLGDELQHPDTSYPYVAEKIRALIGRDLYEGMNNEIERPIYLPKLDLAGADPINPTGDTIVDTAAIPGLKVVIPAASTTTREGDPFTGSFSITEVPRDLAPISLPASMRPDLLMTIQPAELTFAEPVAVTIPNRGGNPPGSFSDLVAINPTTGQFEVVGRMQASEDGSVLETIQGGLRTTNWFLEDSDPTVAGEESEATNDDACKCQGETEQTSSEVQLFTGALLEEHTTASYQSLGQARSLTLKYDSMRADPRHVVRFGANRNFGALQPILGARLEFSSGNQKIIPPQEELLAPEGDSLSGSFWQSEAVNADLGIEVDFSNLPTDVFDWEVDLGLFDVQNGQWSGNWNTGATSGIVVHVNEQANPFGAGWTLENWSRVVETGSGDALVVLGDGTQILFERQADGSYQAPPIVFDTLTKEPDGSFQLRTRTQTVYQFGDHGQQTTMTDRVGNQTTFSYDASGKIQSYEDEAGLVTQFVYNATGERISQIVDPLGRVTSLQHDASGNLEKITDPDNASRTFLWNSRGNMIGEIDQLGRMERTLYGPTGRVIASVQKTGETVYVNPVQPRGVKPLPAVGSTNYQPGITELADRSATRYDPVAQFVDRNGRLTEKELTPIGFFRDGSDDIGETGQVSRNSRNLISEATDPDGHTDRFEYDNLGNVISIRDALNGGNRVAGQIDTPGQQQLYSFTITDETTLLLDPMTPDPVFTWSLDGPQGRLVDQQGFDIRIFDSSESGVRVIPGEYLLTVDAWEGFTGDFTFRIMDVSAAPTLPLGVETVITFDPDNQTSIYQLDVKPGKDYVLEFADINDVPEIEIINPLTGRSITSGPARELSLTERFRNSLEGPLAISFGCPFDIEDLPEGETKPPQSFPIILHEIEDDVRPIVLGETVERTLEAPTETSTFEFEVEANSRVSIAVPAQSEGIQALLSGPRGAIFDTEAERFDAGQFGFVPDFGSRSLHLESGSYELQIAGVNSGKPSFAVALADAGPDQESVFSGGPAFGDAPLIGLDQFVSGQTDGAGQPAYFDFTLSQREVVFVSGSSGLPGLRWTLEGAGVVIEEDADGNPLTLATSFAGSESNRALALERGDYRVTLTPTTTNVGDFEFTLVGLAANPVTANTNINVTLGGNTQAVALMIQTDSDQSWTVNANSINGIDPNDAVIRIIDSTGRDVAPSLFWSAENVQHYSKYDGELYLLIGSRETIPAGSSITLSASPFDPRLLPINLNETISEILTGTAPLNAHAFAVETETLVAVDFDSGSPGIEWALYDAAGQVFEGNWFEDAGGIAGGGIGEGIGGGEIGGGNDGLDSSADPQPLVLLPAGDYTLEVSQSGFDTVDYSLTITDVRTAELLDSAQSETLTLTDTLRSAYRGIILDEDQEVIVEVSQLAGLAPEAFFQLVNPSGNNVAFYPLDAVPTLFTVNEPGRYTVVIDQGPYNDPVSATPSLTVSTKADNVIEMPLGSLQRGTTESPYQTESFTFSGVAGQAVLLQHLTSATPSADLTLIGPGGNAIVTSSSGAEVTEPIILTKDGTYQVRAGGNGTSGDFRFRLLNLNAANSLSAGLPRAGQLSEPSAPLAYRVSATVGQRVQISLAAGDENLLRRRVFSAAGVLLADSGSGQHSFTANHAADFYVVVDAQGAASTDDLSFAIVADDLTNGSVIDSPYDAPLSGSITPGSIDEYNFTASAGVAVRLRRTDFDSGVLQVELISPSGQPINLDKVFAFPESGTFTLRVRGIQAGDAGDYELALDRIDQIATDAGYANRLAGILDPGQAVVQRWNLTAGQDVAFDGGGAAVSASRIRIYDPNLGVVFDGAGSDDFHWSAKVSGPYWLVVDSATASAADYSFRLLNFSDASNVTPGLPVARSLNDGNDLEVFQFVAANGQRLYVDGGISRFQTWTLYDPFMNEVFSRPANVSGGLGEFELPLHLTGSYTLAFDSSRATPQTFTFVAYLSDVGEPLEINPYASGTGTTITYDPVFNVPTEIVDDEGRLTRFVIDPANGNVLSTTRIFGEDDATSGETDDLTSTYTYTTFGLVDTMTDPLGRIADYDYDNAGNVTKTTYALGTADQSTMFYEYDSAGNVSAMIDAVGNRTEYKYDQLNRLLVMRNALLDETQYTYDDRGNRLTYTNQRGNTWTYTYDNLDRLETITDPLGQVQRYTYDDIGNLIGYTDKLGRVTRYQYDARDRLVALMVADGGVTHWTYDGNGNIATITDPLGRISQYFYDARDQEVGMIDADGNRMTYRYDSVGNLVSVTDPLGRITRSRYDELDRLIQVDYIAPDIVGHTTTFQYDKADNLVETTDPLSRTTKNVFDQLDRLVSQTRAFGTLDAATLRFEYDAESNLVATIDANSNRSEYDYDTLNRVEVNRDALNQETSYGYDPVGNVVSVTDRRGFVTEFEFDPLDRLTKTTDALTHQWATEYDAVDNVLALTDPLGRRDTFTYDPVNRLLTRTDSVGNVTTNTYDVAGNVRTITDGRNNVTTYDYDRLDRIASILDAEADLTTFRYDGISNLLATTDALGRIKQYDYDGLDRIVQQRWFTGSFSGGPGDNHEDVTVTNYAYDIMGNLLALTDGLGNQTSWTYDNLDRQVTMTDPLLGTETYAYDPLGLVSEITDRSGFVTTYDYDRLNRLETETWVDGLSAYGGTGDFVVSYGYDPESNVTSVVDPLSSLAFTYDALNRIESEDNAGTPNVPQVDLTFAYDQIGNRISVTEQIGGSAAAVTAYEYDDADRIRSITQSLASGGVTGTVADKRVDFTFNEVNQFESLTRYGDLSDTSPVIATTYAYDTINRLIDLRHQNSGGADLAFYTFDYDAEDRLTQITDSRGTIDYGYDGRGQLIAANYSDARADESYEFDQNGNRLESSRHGATYQTGDNNRLLSDGRYSYEYNERGDMIVRTDMQTGETREFTWDHRGRLARIDDLTALGILSNTVSYSYDGFDRRITRSVDIDGAGADAPTIESFVYDGDNVLLDFVDGDLTARYLHGPAIDQVLAREDFMQTNTGQVDEVYWHLHDQLGSTREITDSSGAIANQITLDTFGNVVDQTDPSAGTRYLFTGREYDEATGEYYYRARYYDPTIGRFLTEDPIGFTAGDANLYRYVGNTPTSFRDPDGLEQIYPYRAPTGFFAQAQYVVNAGVSKALNVAGAGTRGFGRGLGKAAGSAYSAADFAGAAIAATGTHYYADVSDGLETLTGLELAGSDFARQRSQEIYLEKLATADQTVRAVMNMSSEQRSRLLKELADSVAGSAKAKLTSLYNKALNDCYEELAEELGEFFGEAAPELLLGAKGAGHIRKLDFDGLKREVVDLIKEERGSLPLDKATREAIKRGDAPDGDVLVLGRGDPNALSEVAEAAGGRVIDNPAIADNPRALWKHIQSEMRKADKIIQVIDDIPTKQVTGRGSGEWARAEKLFIDNSEVLRDKRTLVRRADLGLE